MSCPYGLDMVGAAKDRAHGVEDEESRVVDGLWVTQLVEAFVVEVYIDAPSLLWSLWSRYGRGS